MKPHTKQLAELFDKIEIKYAERDNDCLGITISTESYIDHSDGEKSLLVIAYVDTKTNLVRLYAPNIVDLTSSDYREKTAQLLLWMNYRSDLARFEMDYTDNEVRCSIASDCGETFITHDQLEQMLSSLLNAIDSNWETITEALTTGKLPETLYAKNEKQELADLIRAAGGVEGLREILNERGLIK